MEQYLFPLEIEQLSIKESALELNVSTATIRNWVKTGYLHEKTKGYIAKDSIDYFIHQHIGQEKLTHRANKSCKRDDNKVTGFSIENISSSQGMDTIGTQYESSLPEAFRNKEGIYYTPNYIIDEMLSNYDLSKVKRFLDPCCGSGNFLIQAIKKGLKPEAAFGFDTDINAVTITRKRIYELTGFDAINTIKHLDFLDIADKINEEEHYDLIFTNPPWGKKLSKSDKDRLSTKYKTGKSLDSSSLFYFAARSILKKDGILGFLVQDALFNISSYQDARNDILSHQILQIRNYKKAFKGLVTSAIAFIIKNKCTSQGNELKIYDNSTINIRTQTSFLTNPYKIINYWIREDEAKLIEYLYHLPHKTLQNNARWALGIVTGNNKKFCRSTPQEDYIPVYKGSDITPKGLKNATTFIHNNLKQYQQVAAESLYLAEEKIIYKFISSNLCFHYDKEQCYILNSANLLIPNKELGISCNNLAKLLNSNFYNWLFKALFGTHKILRGDLERLPIYIDYFKEHSIFSEESLLNYLGIIKQNGTYCIKK